MKRIGEFQQIHQTFLLQLLMDLKVSRLKYLHQILMKKIMEV